MSWSVRFHREAEQDLKQLGTAEARRILKVIRERIAEGEPDKMGKPLRGILAG
jgi:mRNA interferase RelE/StbE